MTFTLRLIALVALLLPFTAQAQEQENPYGVRLTIESPDGPISFLIQDTLVRDAAAGTLTMSGHVQVRRDPDLLLDAQTVIATTLAAEAATTAAPGRLNLDNLSQIASLQLIGDVFAKVGAVQIQAPSLTLSTQDQSIDVPNGPVTVRNGQDYLQAGGGLRAELTTRTFYGFGGVTANLGGTQVSANKLQVTLPAPGASNQFPHILASGEVRFWGPDFDLAVGRIQSSDDGKFLYLSQGLTYVGQQGAFTAGSGVINMETQEFTLDRSTDSPIRAQSFIGD